MKKKRTHSKDNILTDLYNLNLTGNPKEDKRAIIDFFKKYDPSITKYITSNEYSKQFDDPDVFDVDGYGSLGYYELTKGQSWFDTDDVKKFYDLWNLAKELVDTIVENKLLTQDLLLKIENLLENVKPSLYVINKKAKEQFAVKERKLSDYKGYEFIQRLRYETSISKLIDTQKTDHKISLGLIKFNLFNAILPIINGKDIIRKCQLETCRQAFIAYKSGVKNIYCSEKHKLKAFELKKRLTLEQ